LYARRACRAGLLVGPSATKSMLARRYVVVMALLALLAAPAVAKKKRRKFRDQDGVAKKKKNYQYITSNGTDEMGYLGKMSQENALGLVVAFLDERGEHYYTQKSAFNEAAGVLKHCLGGRRVYLLRIGDDAGGRQILQALPEDHEMGSRGSLIQRERQVRLEVPLTLYFCQEHGIPQPFTWVGGFLNWTTPTLVQWAHEACSIHVKASARAARGWGPNELPPGPHDEL